MISTEKLSDLFVDVADTLVADFDIVDFLTTLCEHATVVSGADAVGIMLTDHRGDLRFMAASNDYAVVSGSTHDDEEHTHAQTS